MQISDLFGQYVRNSNPSVSGEAGVKSTEQLVSSIRELAAGNVFEGTVDSIENGQVTLGLSNGSQILARLEGAVALQEGQSMFFQVKSNNGTTVAIRPFVVDGKAVNPILSDALSAANLPADEKNLNLVKSMMEEQLPIDKGHLSDMARLLLNHPEIDPETVVALTKYKLPVTAENATQYENYKADRQSVSRQMEQFLDELPELFSDASLSAEDMLDQGGRLLSILSGEGETVSENPDAKAAETGQSVNGTQQPVEAEAQTETAGKTKAGETQQITQNMEEKMPSGETVKEVSQEASKEAVDGKALVRQLFIPETAKEGRQTLFQTAAEGRIEGKELLKELAAALSDRENWPKFDTHAVRDLFSSEKFHALVRDTLKEQWSIRPEELTKEGSVRELYEKLDSQLKQLEDAVKASGQNHPGVEQTAAEIRSNIHFMDQISQVYNYVQLPLKMSRQNANGELYVYTNKRPQGGKDRELSAFLHLDMEHLGAADVSVKLFGNHVSAKFYLDNDTAYSIVQEHMPQLEKRLADKGYNCTIEAVNEEKQMNFVDDFLNRDKPVAGQVRRYSFDMRA